MSTVDKFLNDLRRSRLMSADEVQAFMVTLPPQYGESSVKTLAAELVRRGKLTRFQAMRIAAGRPEGLILGKYIIQDKIGEGGMGEVFVAEHRRMKRPVVVKILPQHAVQNEHSKRRFQREVEAAAKLHHPHIVTAYDADEEDGIHFLVLEFVDGQPLGDIVQRDGPLPISKSVSCILQAARGLDYAHAQGVVHRDIKPNNLLLDRTGVVKVLDMGLARFDDGRRSLADAADPDSDSLTRDNQILGTAEYMAPEQVDDSSGADRRSDIYSLGCTWFRLLLNRPPFLGETLVQTLIAHRTEPVPSVCALRTDAPPQVDLILTKMLAKNPTNRYQTMAEVIGALEDLLAKVGGDPLASHSRGSKSARPEDSDTCEIDLDEPLNKSTTGTSITLDMTVEDSTKIRGRPGMGSSSASMEKPALQAVGIDLGTTFSAIAYLDPAGRPIVLENSEGDKTTPSVVLFEDNEIIVGREAVKAMATDWERIAEGMKRDMGHHEYHRAVNGQKFPPEVLQSCVLTKLVRDAQRIIGSFQQVVITVPAYFDEVRRKATQDAGYIAGLEVLDIINEPTAAALAYGYHRGQLVGDLSEAPKRVLVYDLGGGTFDVTVMEIAQGEFVTLSTDGDVQLGGRDWDQRLLDHAAEHFIRSQGIDPREDPNTFGRMLNDCEDVKRTLSSRQKASLLVSCGGRSERIEISRDRFEELTSDLLERTAFTTKQTLRAAGLEWSDIDVVLLVGGSTRMPAVSRLLKEMSGRDPDASISPDEAVAHGAAIHAGLLLQRLSGKPPRIRVRNVNSHSLGVVGTDPKTNRKQNAVLVPRNTPLPAKAKRIFRTSKSGQRSIVAQIVEGESADPTACMHIGKCTVRNLPGDLPAGTPIEIKFQYEENGRLKVVVQVSGVQEKISYEIARDNNLTRQQMDEWRARFFGKSTHAMAEKP